jgi:type I restriction enzyme M protein
MRPNAMIWIAPSEKDTDTAALEKRLWDAADQFRTNGDRIIQRHSTPALGFIPITCLRPSAGVAL